MRALLAHQSGTRHMDRLLWRLRSHIRSQNLPRPNTITLSDIGPAVAVDYGVGEGRLRLRNLMAWIPGLSGVSLRWVLWPSGYLAVILSTRMGAATMEISAGADIRELGGSMEYQRHAAFGHLAGHVMPTEVVSPVTETSLNAVLGTRNTRAGVAA
ncbi:hypothetical protein [Kutzneria kofuensis]|uniref:Uncharacterized protein n=1 Tax=Kutzneria kofuensis TaxID=103725 RepID=A0A7W9KDM4_9PSEU|nr:hypothetical protein [Kutzneria kofuensis]MBB5890670.1 hypothetical protein [Kutzneria kofuensis]